MLQESRSVPSRDLNRSSSTKPWVSGTGTDVSRGPQAAAATPDTTTPVACCIEARTGSSEKPVRGTLRNPDNPNASHGDARNFPRNQGPPQDWREDCQLSEGTSRSGQIIDRCTPCGRGRHDAESVSQTGA